MSVVEEAYSIIKKTRNEGEAIQLEEYKPFQVFINHVDTFRSKYISAFISEQIYGATRYLQTGAEEDEGLEEEQPRVATHNLPTEKYVVAGSVSEPRKQPSEDILLVTNENDEDFCENILKCGFVIYDITKDEAQIDKALKTLSIITEHLEEKKKIGPKTYENFNESQIFILISTVMTWALTKPLDPDDPDLPFSEVDYKKRRPHPNYKKHYACEKEVIKIGQKYKEKLKTYVVCAGLTYGEEEDDLEFFFKMAWHGELLPIFGSGDNIVPLIHVQDLARAVHGLMENTPPKPRYILAVEQTPTKLKQLIKSLSKAMSDGKTTNVIAEEAFLYTTMTQTIFDRCTVNINMEPVFLLENLQLVWKTESNLAENMNQIVAEFKNRRNLKPVKIVLHGPPGSGKTQLAQKLCEYYKCKYVSIASMLEDFERIEKENLTKPEKNKLESTELLGEGDEEAVEEEEYSEDLLEQIREMKILAEKGLENVPNNYITDLLKRFLAKNFCQNQGYILDGYPEVTNQAKLLFGGTEPAPAEAEEEEEERDVLDVEKLRPDLVVSLVSTDEFITHRIMKLPEKDIKDTPYSETNLLNRLEIYRQRNTDDETVLNYFDELETDILLLEVQDDDEEAFRLITHKLGPPASFGLSAAEQEELDRLEEEEKRLASAKEELSKQIELGKAEEERKKKMEAWSQTLERLKAEEEKILVAQSEPLRQYLMKYVFPTLSKGLIELAKIKPEDPLDFLAEYLFKENPEGKMFDPSYNTECEDLYNCFREYIEKIIDEHEGFNN